MKRRISLSYFALDWNNCAHVFHAAIQEAVTNSR
jgi:hypothetical protein